MNNYYPFGMLSLRNPELDSGLQPGRYWQSGDYRFGLIPNVSGQVFVKKYYDYQGD
jgi:hypothetical protein